jgi:uncharacterized protein HemY
MRPSEIAAVSVVIAVWGFIFIPHGDILAFIIMAVLSYIVMRILSRIGAIGRKVARWSDED